MQSIANPPGSNPVSDPHSAKVSTLVLIFRIVRWTVYACALIVLILLLHKSAPPRRLYHSRGRRPSGAEIPGCPAGRRTRPARHPAHERNRTQLVLGVTSGPPGG